ncbi:hypothetical protein MKC93_12135 [[Clostridium] innocuum]|nr:hypothetical protein [[Clostridium] innocuum]
MKKLFATAAAMAMFLSLGATTVLAADEDTKDVDVTYDNSETIVDPTDPDAGKWGGTSTRIHSVYRNNKIRKC